MAPRQALEVAAFLQHELAVVDLAFDRAACPQEKLAGIDLAVLLHHPADVAGLRVAQHHGARLLAAAGRGGREQRFHRLHRVDQALLVGRREPQQQRGGSRRAVAIFLILSALAAALYYVFAPSSPQQRRGGRFVADGPVPVLVAAAVRTDVPVHLDAVGTIRALNTVTVRPQVDGKLLSVNFKEGDDVRKGDVLANIDPVIYQAQLDQAIAKKAQDEAQLANARIDLERYEKLAATNAINKQQADTQRAMVAQ